MIQMMMAIAGNGASAAARSRSIERQRQAWLLRKMVGFAIVAGGFAVLGAQALQHLQGG
ncbi:hypothetical protein [Burkholderia sp. SRS-W-2-2016]|uniref:hypothetical protein n=1 Tax=Burkholderia sp. SRS-W-2-2016 TaxID=1926878 RepID=UPI0015C01A0A|nr:hypothetical protein [Burkholderia sp. SRS-W-2-2016]